MHLIKTSYLRDNESRVKKKKKRKDIVSKTWELKKTNVATFIYRSKEI